MFEINLVPDVKAEMIAAQKKRNVVFFASVVVAVIAAGLVLLLLTVKIGQDAKIAAQDNTLELMSHKIEEYDGLEDLLTVQKQLSNLDTIGSNKRLLTRAFTVLYSIVNSTTNGDEVNITALNVDLEGSVLSFDGQANAGPNTDNYDYRVLESFQKTIKAMKYDYGRYVDKEGNVIPTMCIIETSADGVPFSDENGVYAVWAKGVDGCDPSKSNQDSESESSSSSASMQIQNVDRSGHCEKTGDLICIRRTPLFKEWYADDSSSSKPKYMTADGQISGIEHFESQCITYSRNGETGRWTTTNECNMTKIGDDGQPIGLVVSSSSNGRENSGEFVLMFSATLPLDNNVFLFSNKHMITVLPSGKQNVTDSYIQIGDMFAEKAKAVKGGE